MREITLDEFVRRIKRLVREHPDSRFCSFLGAGSSRSSGIPMAGQLVEQWLPKLKELKTGGDDDLWSWANGKYENIEEQPSSYYGEIIEALFHTPQERQQEIERITAGKDPSFGYAVLGMLMSHQRFGPHLNMVITTNFDDMVADALYLYTQKKPLVITHEALSGFVRPSRLRPLVVKIHGDAQLAPKNTADETNFLDTKMQRAVQRILRDSGLIFTGYAGADESVVKLLDDTDTDSLPWGIYWINTSMPASEAMCEWLEKRQAVWVKHLDFDQLMLAMWQVFELKHPDMSRFDHLKETYEKTFRKLEERAKNDPEALSKETALTEGLKRAGDELDWWDIELEAQKYADSNSKRAEEIYREGIKKVPDSAPLMGNFAIFLENIRQDYDEAEKYYKNSLELEPEDSDFLGNYATFLTDIRKEHDKAEEFYRKALTLEPEDADHLGAYSAFLIEIRQDYDEAETHLRKALELETEHTINLSNYANFLVFFRRKYDEGEKLFQKVLEIAPEYIHNLGSYANFLVNIRQDYYKAERLYQRALNLQPQNVTSLGNYARIKYIFGEDEDALRLLKKAETSSPHPALKLEILFYRFAHLDENKPSVLQELKNLLSKGVRSPGWMSNDNVEVAVKKGHPQPDLLAALAKVISDKADIETLEAFPAWQAVD